MKARASKIIIWLVVALWLGNLLKTQPWRGDYGVINNDVISYYSYLPAALIYGDLTFQFTDSLDEDTKYRIWYLTSEDGKRFQKMSLGCSMMYLPFFLVGHGWASMSSSAEFAPTGFTFPYQLMLCLSSIFYAAIGLFLLRKILLRYFNELAVCLTLLGLGVGTNLFYYTTVEGPMTHAYNFLLFTLVLYHTIKWHEHPSIKSAILIGLGIGLAGVIRPTNLIVALVPLLYNVYDQESIRIKIKQVLVNWKHVAVMVVTTFLCAIPLLLYWKLCLGSWIYYSYTDEGFFFLNPKLYEGMFGFRKGWLVYTPLMVLSLVGMFFMKNVRGLKYTVPIFMALNYYVILSWWCWWYGGSYGLRTMIDSYGVLAVPMCAVVHHFTKDRRWILSGTMVLLFASLIALNIFQMWQYRVTIMHWDSMNRRLYEEIFLSKHFPENYEALKTPPDYDKAKRDEEGF